MQDRKTKVGTGIRLCLASQESSQRLSSGSAVSGILFPVRLVPLRSQDGASGLVLSVLKNLYTKYFFPAMLLLPFVLILLSVLSVIFNKYGWITLEKEYLQILSCLCLIAFLLGIITRASILKFNR